MTPSSAFTASLPVAERAAYGRDARKRASRSCHGWFEADADAGRTDPIEVIERQSATRLQDLVPIRYGRMLESPFRFYRGAASIMASDLGPLPNTGLTVQLCGDAHLLNFRLLASPERHLVFDINDFDETLAGPFEWDVKRLAAEPRDRGPRQRLPDRGAGQHGAGVCEGVPGADARVRRHVAPSTSGTRRTTPTGCGS